MKEPKTLRAKAEAVLGAVFRGLHNVPGKIQDDGIRIFVNVPASQLSTFDFDGLTRLVVLAHDECVRASINACNPQMVRIVFHDRTGREGHQYERHPTIEDAITRIRRN